MNIDVSIVMALVNQLGGRVTIPHSEIMKLPPGSELIVAKAVDSNSIVLIVKPGVTPCEPEASDTIQT